VGWGLRIERESYLTTRKRMPGKKIVGMSGTRDSVPNENLRRGKGIGSLRATEIGRGASDLVTDIPGKKRILLPCKPSGGKIAVMVKNGREKPRNAR